MIALFRLRSRPDSRLVPAGKPDAGLRAIPSLVDEPSSMITSWSYVFPSTTIVPKVGYSISVGDCTTLTSLRYQSPVFHPMEEARSSIPHLLDRQASRGALSDVTFASHDTSALM